MKDAKEYISALFADWTESEQNLFAEKLERVEIKEGETLFSRGDKADAFYFITYGQLGVKKSTGFEDKTQVIALLDAGAPFGERGLIRTAPFRSAEVIAVQDSQLYRLPAVEYHRFAAENPACALQFMEWLLSRLSLRLEKASERLAHIL